MDAKLTIYIFVLCILAFSCISYSRTINNYKFECSVEVYHLDVYPIEVYLIDLIEAYLVDKGAIEVTGCHPHVEKA